MRLLDLFAADPAAFFEPGHLAAYGPEPAILIKLLDAGERLPLHLHPDRDFAASHLGAANGKTEAWVILDAGPGATVHVGFARDVGADELAELAAAQNLGRFTEIMNRLSVSNGDAIYVPAGLPHVIGEGILLLEVQEPSDLSLLLEWEGVVSEEQAYLGLPRDLALTAVTRSAVDPIALTASRGTALFPAEADRFFRAERVAGGDRFEPAFSVLIVTEGVGVLRTEGEKALQLARGSTVLVPFGAGEVELAGSLRAIRCRPPTP